MPLGQSILKNIATLGPVGYLPWAPGTFASLAALLFFALVRPSLSASLFLLLILLVAGTMASERAERLLNEKDSRHIVIDEVAGYAVSVLALPQEISYYIAAFLLFRFFDILKPPPIRNIETILSGGFAIMADDILAGLFSNALLQIWKLLTGN